MSLHPRCNEVTWFESYSNEEAYCCYIQKRGYAGFAMTEQNSSRNKRGEKSQLIPLILSKLSDLELGKRDIFGRTILHILILANRYDLIRHLLKNPSSKVTLMLSDYENGWNCMHYIFFHKRLRCLKAIVESVLDNKTLLKNLVYDLLRGKDRNRVTPLNLLDNDIKDFVYAPEYIDEGEYHFSKRFVTSPGPNQKTSKQANIESEKYRNRKDNWWYDNRGGSEIYVLGSNKNNNLGIGDTADRNIPSMIPHDNFKDSDEGKRIYEKLLRPRYKTVVVSKNHSTVLTTDGQVYTSGLSSRGRLGHGYKLVDSFHFKRVRFFGEEDSSIKRFIIKIATSNDHSLALTNDNVLYSWGLNDYFQLGFFSTSEGLASIGSSKAEAYEAVPKEIYTGDLRKNVETIKGVSVSKIHSLAYTSHDIFFWGLCVGQMGIPYNSDSGNIKYRFNNRTYKGFLQNSPRRVTFRDTIKTILTSETCTCIITTNNEVHVFYRYQHFKLPKPANKASSEKHFDLFKPTKLTKPLNIEKVCLRTHEFIVMLLDSGQIFCFSLAEPEQEDSNLSKIFKNIKYTTLWRSYSLDMRATDVDVAKDGSTILCTRNGSVFMKSNAVLSRSNSVSEASFITATPRNKFKKIEILNKIAKVACDDSFLTFSFIRDDIDMIPFKVPKNDFMVDMQYLNVLNRPDGYRKQSQLLFEKKMSNFYISDFLRPNFEDSKDPKHMSYQILDERHEFEESEFLDGSVNYKASSRNQADFVYGRHLHRYDAILNKNVRKYSTYIDIAKSEEEVLSETLLLPTECFTLHIASTYVPEKCYDSFFTFKSYPSVKVGIHLDIFVKRSPKIVELITSSDLNMYWHEDLVVLRFNPYSKVFYFDCEINPKSVAIFVHYIYTDKILKIWELFSSGINCPREVKEIKSGFESLMKLFSMSDIHERYLSKNLYFSSMKMLLESGRGDISVKLSDGEVSCHSYVLKARSAFFETLLSNRWSDMCQVETKRVLQFDHISVFEFLIILRYLYGFSDMEVFDVFDSSFKADYEVDDFISCLLNLIDISDEFLLFRFKQICQLAIKDMITSENVFTLLEYSDLLSANYLFKSCCWYIYNNMEILLLDNAFLKLSYELLRKLEREIIVLHQCKLADMLSEDAQLNDNLIKTWIENMTGKLARLFLFDIREFNDIFNSDKKGFLPLEPLVDFRSERKLTNDARKSLSSKSQSKLSHDDLKASIMDFRSAVRQNPNSPGSAIDDSTGFELVKSRRKSKVSNEASKITEETDVFLQQNTVIPSNNRLTLDKESRLRSNTSQDPKVSNNESLNLEPRPILREAPPLNKQPILGKKVDLTEIGKSAKIKIGPTARLSQKERQRKAAEGFEEVKNKDEAHLNVLENFSNPWARLLLHQASTKLTLNEAQFPTLGDKKRNKNDHFGNDCGNLENSNNSAHYGHQPDKKQLERKTLQDIQQEQLFAKWWEEEAARVQEQMRHSKPKVIEESQRKKNRSKPRKNLNRGKSDK